MARSLFPGGASVGLLLLTNLLAAHWLRLERSRRKAGMWLAHLGLILLFAGEFAAAAFRTESRLALQEGRPKNYSEETHRAELVLMDAADPARDKVYAVPRELFNRPGDVRDARMPVALRVLRVEASPADGDGGAGRVVADVEALDAGRSLGVWRLLDGSGTSREFTSAGRVCRLAVRPARRYFPYTLTLEKFRRDVYPGTDIPKNFSSRVRLSDPDKGPDRGVLISMNSPLRYGGRTFYQSGFGMNDTLSVFQVVENPSRRLPYVSCVMVAVGLLIHFLSRLRRGPRRAGA